MMLKNFFSDCKTIGQTMRRTVWLSSIFSIVLFFALPVAVMILASNTLDGTPATDLLNLMSSRLLRFFQLGGNFVGALVVLGGVVAALSAFSYLNSKKQIDLFHSLPITRGRLFLLNYISGALNFIIPLVAALLLSLIALLCTGLGAAIPLGTMAIFGLQAIFYFLIFYNISVFVAMLCGNLIISVLGVGTFLGILPALYTLKNYYMGFFFETFLGDRLGGSEIYLWLTPLAGLALKGSLSAQPLLLLWYAFWGLAFGAGAFFLCRIRPSEGAEKAIAFPKAKNFLKYPTAAAATLGMGAIFSMIGSSAGQRGWLVFGLLCGAVLSCCIIDVVFGFDFREAFRHFRGCGVFVAGVALVFGVLVFDLVGYDRYVPKLSGLSAASFQVMGFEDYDPYGYRGAAVGSNNLLNPVKEPVMLETAVKLGQLGVDALGKHSEGDTLYVMVCYRSRWGFLTERGYSIPREALTPVLQVAYETDDCLRGRNPLFLKDMAAYSAYPTGVSGNYGSYEVDTQARKGIASKELTEAMQQDILEQNFEDFQNNLPLFALVFVENRDTSLGEMRHRDQFAIPIYGSYRRTLACLKSLGVEESVFAPDLEDIVSMDVSRYIAASVQEEKPVALPPADAAAELTITEETTGREAVSVEDKAVIAAVLKNAYFERGLVFNPFFEEAPYRAMLIFREDYSGEFEKMGGELRFAKDKVPPELAGLFEK